MNTTNFFDSYSADTSGLIVNSRQIAGKFVVTVICKECRKKIARTKSIGTGQENSRSSVINAVDENLARTIAFAMDNLIKHWDTAHSKHWIIPK